IRDRNVTGVQTCALPIYKAVVYKYDFNIMLEVHRNENANKKRNTRAFGNEENDSMTTAQFETNDFNIATNDDRNHIKRNPRFIRSEERRVGKESIDGREG